MSAGLSDLSGARIFITGGAGFIGSHIAARCLTDNEITIYDDFTRDALAGTVDMDHPNLSVIKGDVLDRDALSLAIRGHEVVFHCAAVLGVQAVQERPVRTLEVNVLGSAAVLEGARGIDSIHRLVFFSTSEVFGMRAVSAAESSDAVIPGTGEPRWSYAVSKLAEEHFAMAYHKEAGLPVSVVRPFNVYGPGQVGEGAIANFVRDGLHGRPLKVRGSGSQLRAWCFIDDMVDGAILAAVNPAAIGESFNIGNPWAVDTTLGLAYRVLSQLNSLSPIEFEPGGADVGARTPDITKASSVLGFLPRVGLDDGISQTIAWFRNHR